MRALGLQGLPRMLPEFLSSAISRSQYSLYFPEGWFHTTLARVYRKRDHFFTGQMWTHDPLLLKHFVQADINVLLRDEAISAELLYDFTWHKYGVGTYATEVLLELHSLHNLVAVAHEHLQYGLLSGANNLTTFRKPNGEVNAYSHHTPRGREWIIPRTDNVRE